MAPFVAWILVPISMQAGAFGGIFYGFISLAIIVATLGLIPGTWIVFGRSSVIFRSFGVFFTVLNLLTINGVVGLLQR